MTQAPLQLEIRAIHHVTRDVIRDVTQDTTAAADRTAFDIGWDHAHHGLAPSPEWLLPNTPLCQGWLAARAVFGSRTLASSRGVRQWLQLRLQALQQGIAFDTLQVTPNHLVQIDTTRCPVRRVPLGGAAGTEDAAVTVRLNPHAAYAAGNLAVMSALAARAREGLSAAQCQRRAQQAALQGSAIDGINAAGWHRLAALRAFTTPLPFADAARMPLAVMPPNRVRLLNAAQGLQALLTRCFLRAGWSGRCRTLAQWLPEHTLRHDFNLFVGAMAPRVLEAGNDLLALRLALEDAWLHERVQRRWQHLVLSLGEAATEALLARAVQAGVAGMRTVNHPAAQAVEGWSLPVQLTHARALPNGIKPSQGAALVAGLKRRAAPAGRPGTTRPPAAPTTHA
ncbi:MAG: hypothetical protein LH480_09690 [Rubrivivax sp.]|nr:hypothetical protein [Rubrivivax sp.]